MWPFVDIYDEPEKFTPNQTLDMIVAAFHKGEELCVTEDKNDKLNIIVRKFDFGGETLTMTVTLIGMATQPYINIHAEARTFSATALIRCLDLQTNADTGFKILTVHKEKYRLGKLMSYLASPIGHFENMEETLAILKLAVSDVPRD